MGAADARPESLSDLICFRDWLDAFVDLSKTLEAKPANGDFDCWVRLIGSWGSYELRTPLFNPDIVCFDILA